MFFAVSAEHRVIQVAVDWQYGLGLAIRCFQNTLKNPRKSWMEHLHISLPTTFFFNPNFATWQNDFKSSTAQIPERVFDADLLIWDPFCRRAGLRTSGEVDKKQE